MQINSTMNVRGHHSHGNNRRATRPGSKWGPEDDRRLVRARSEDMAWDAIARTYFRNVSGNACRKRHERLMDTLRADEFNGPRRSDLIQAYTRRREEMWMQIANDLAMRDGRPLKWQTVEKKIFETGIKALVRNARAAARGSRADSSDGIDSDGIDSDGGETLADEEEIEDGCSTPDTITPKNYSIETVVRSRPLPSTDSSATPPARVSSMPISAMLVSDSSKSKL